MNESLKTVEELSRERVQYIIDEFCDGNRMEFSHRTGIGKSSISQYINGTNAPGNITAAKIGDTFGLNPMWIMGFEAPMRYYEPIDYESYGLRKPTVRSLPVVGEISCGEPIYANEERRYVALEDVPEQATCVLIARGDSMINARIQDGDMVFIIEQPTVENGEIAAVIIDDEATLKRFYYDRESETITLIAENPAYAPLIYSGKQLEQVKILGKAIAFQSLVR